MWQQQHKKYPQFVSKLKAQSSALYEVVYDPTYPVLIKLYLFVQVCVKKYYCCVKSHTRNF